MIKKFLLSVYLKNYIYFNFLVIFFFVFSVNVNAKTSMYLQCDFNANNCDGVSECQDSVGWNSFAVINDANGKPVYMAFNTNKWLDFELYFRMEEHTYWKNKEDGVDTSRNVNENIGLLSKECWFKNVSDIGKSCDDGAEMLDSGYNNLKNGICPVGVRQYFGEKDEERDHLFGSDVNFRNGWRFYRVAAGKSDIEPIINSVLEKPEFILYKLNEFNGKKLENTYFFEMYTETGSYGMVFYSGIDPSNVADFEVIRRLKYGIGVSRTKTFNATYVGPSFSDLFAPETDCVDSKFEPCTPIEMFFYVGNFIDYENFYVGDKIIIADDISFGSFSQIYRLYNLGPDYYKISNDSSELYKITSLTLLGPNVETIVHTDTGTVTIKNAYHIKNEHMTTVFSSSKLEGLENEVLLWYDHNKDVIDRNNQMFNGLKSLDGLYENASILLESVENNESFHFADDYNVVQMIDDLEKAYEYLNSYNSENNKYAIVKDKLGTLGYTENYVNAIENYIFYKYLGTPLIEEYQDKGKNYGGFNDSTNYFTINPNPILGSFLHILEDVTEKMVKSESIYLTNINDVKEYISLYYEAIANIDKYSDSFSLSSEQKDRVSQLRNKYAQLGEMYDIYVMVDCKSVIGEELYDKIMSFLNIFRIAIPISLIVFGVVDFTKAIFTNDDGKMKQAQMTFIKRIGIAILIFLVPSFVSIILQIANSVWSFINPDVCF